MKKRHKAQAYCLWDMLSAFGVGGLVGALAGGWERGLKFVEVWVVGLVSRLGRGTTVLWVSCLRNKVSQKSNFSSKVPRKLPI